VTTLVYCPALWRTDNNEASFLKRLKPVVAKETGWRMAGVEFVHVVESRSIADAMKGSPVSRIVWVGHVLTYTHTEGTLMLENAPPGKDLIEGDAFAKLLPRGAQVRVLGCDSTGVSKQMKKTSRSLHVHSRAGDRQLNVEFSKGPDQSVHRVWFSPWHHTQ
jgi:hypothetical protein